MSDVVLESIRAIIMALILGYLFWIGRREAIRRQQGWSYIVAGFTLVFLGSLIDITDNFPSLDGFVAIGDTRPQAFLEKVVGFLLGFTLILVGFLHWLPLTAKNVTGARQSETALEGVRRQNEFILASAGEGIYGLDLEGNTTFVNPAAAAMIGYGVEDLIGLHQHSVVHHSRPDGSSYPVDECPIYAAINDGAVHQVDDEVFSPKDGTSFPVSYTSRPIRDEQGRLQGAVVTFRDNTARRLAKERQERWAEESRLMAEIGRVVGSSLEIEEVYERFAELVQGTLLFNWITINTVDMRNRAVVLAHITGVEIPDRTTGAIPPWEAHSPNTSWNRLMEWSFNPRTWTGNLEKCLACSPSLSTDSNRSWVCRLSLEEKRSPY